MVFPIRNQSYKLFSQKQIAFATLHWLEQCTIFFFLRFPQVFWVCQMIFSLFFLVWNLLVAVVLVSVARTQTISIRRLVAVVLVLQPGLKPSVLEGQLQQRQVLYLGLKPSVFKGKALIFVLSLCPSFLSLLRYFLDFGFEQSMRFTSGNMIINVPHSLTNIGLLTFGNSLIIINLSISLSLSLSLSLSRLSY